MQRRAAGGRRGDGRPRRRAGLPVDERWARVGVSLTTLAAVLAVAAVLTRGLSAERPPWGNMYEFTVTGVAALLVIWVAMLPTPSGVA